MCQSYVGSSCPEAVICLKSPLESLRDSTFREFASNSCKSNRDFRLSRGYKTASNVHRVAVRKVNLPIGRARPCLGIDAM